MSNGVERLNRREQNRSSFHFHLGRRPEQKNRTQQKKLLYIQCGRTPEQKRTEQKQLAFPLGQNA
jgi:hypothetical protein